MGTTARNVYQSRMAYEQLTARDAGASGRYRIACSNDAVAKFLSRWLDSPKLLWPGELQFEVHLVDKLPLFDDARPVLTQPRMTIWGGPPDNTVRVVWTKVPAMAIVHPTEPRVDMWLTPAVLNYFESADRTFLLIVLTFVLRRVGWYHVHGAALNDRTGRGWLFAGNSHSGKSTTTALLASQGWSVASDDVGFLIERNGHVDVVGYHAPVALRSGGVDLLKPQQGIPMPQRKKLGVWPQQLGGASIAAITPKRLLFTSVGTATTIVPLEPLRATTELVKWSLWVVFEALRSQEHLDRLARLVSQCQSYQLTLGPDLIQDPTLLERLVNGDPVQPSH